MVVVVRLLILLKDQDLLTHFVHYIPKNTDLDEQNE